MRNLFGFSVCVFPLWAYAAVPVVPIQGDDDAFKVTGSLQELYDSNYTRTPEKNPEQITQPTLGLSLNENWSNQHLSARWQGTRFIFDKLFDESANLQTGGFDWQSQWPLGFKSSINLKRDGYLVDQLEFSGLDISTQNNAVGKVGYGFANGWSFNAGGQGIKQLHTNEERKNIQYDEDNGFAEISYSTPSGSSMTIRGRDGKRIYQYGRFTIDDLDYDYKQAEVETKWVVSSKTDVSLLVARYDRTGELNDGTGTMASFEANWMPTEKLHFKSVYSLQHPSIGETDEAISKVQTASISADWQFSPKLAFGTRLSYSRSHYINIDPLFERSENLINYLPLSISYLPTSHWLLKFDSGWRKNESPLEYRQYISAQGNIAVFFYY